jgi:Glycosyl transferase family 2
MEQIGVEKVNSTEERLLDQRVSIVIEWDNARVSELSRAREMYRALVEQIRRLGDSVAAQGEGGNREDAGLTGAASVHVIEVFILYDALEIDPAVIDAVTTALGLALPAGVALHIVGTPGLGYYELKNEGAKRASGDIVVFLDSDVIPESDWLGQMLHPFRDPSVQVVGGNSYIEPVSLYSRAFALTWFFPLRTPAGPLEATSHFFANNVAWRREFLGRHPFPYEPRFRGQCTTLAATLAKEGIPIYSNPSARVSHPPPNGLSHFFRRALCEGHDLIVDQRLRGNSAPVGVAWSIRLSYRRLRAQTTQLRRTIRSQRERVGLSAAAAPLALALAFLYYATRAAGEVLTERDPRIVRRHFPI